LSEEVQLLPFYGFVWIASLARVFTAVARHEVFATEVTLAAVVVIVLPILARSELCELVLGRRAGSRKHKDS